MSSEGTQPLKGIRVLEFSHTIMGPCAGMVLADLGADVIKVEPLPGGDKTRQLRGFAAGFFATFNRNKRSLMVDLKKPQGQALVHKLVTDTDVVLDNYGPGTMERLNCGYEQLLPLNKRLIFLSLKGYLGGPMQNRPALDEVVQFQSGLSYMTGPPGQPLRAGASVIDILGAVFGVTGVLAALRERDVTGNGQRVGSALFESAAFLMASHMAGGAATGEQVPPMTLRKGAWGIYDVFETADAKQVFIGVTSDAQWQRFCEQFSLAELLSDTRLATNPQRTRHRDWLLPKVEEAMQRYTYRELIDSLQVAEVSWSPIGKPEDLWEDPQLLAGGLIQTALATSEQAASEAIRQSMTGIPGLPLEFGAARARAGIRRQPPGSGEHTVEILRHAGFDDAAVKALLDGRIIAASTEDA